MFLLAQNSFAQAPTQKLTKKQKAFVGAWVIKEFDMKLPKDGDGNSEERKIFDATFEAQKKAMLGKEVFQVYADGTMNMTDEEGKITKATWTYNEKTNIFTTKELENQKVEEIKVNWVGTKPTLTFDESMNTETSEENIGMGMKIVFGKK